MVIATIVLASYKVNVTKLIDINGLPSFLQQLVEVRRLTRCQRADRESTMSVNSRGEESEFDFEELANQLLEQGCDASPSDLHGCLCGLLAAGAAHDAESGLDALNQALDLDLHGELAQQVMALHVATAAALEDEEFDFHPLLMDDSAELAARTAALAGWCRSFLSGYAHQSAAGARQGEALPGNIAEILQDLAAIADADVEELEEDEESEKSYAEVAEYIRFAALNAYTDNAHGGADAAGAGQLPGPIH